jgi:hypothetical protein
MFGFVLGTACLIALVVVISRGRHGRLFGRGRYGYRYGGYGGGPRAALHGLLERLDTGPGQEKVIVGAVEEFVDRARDSGRELRETRRDLADAVRGDRIDEARLSDVFGRHDGALDKLRTAGVDALRKVHETLDERQRKILADVVESGHFGYGFHGRHAC